MEINKGIWSDNNIEGAIGRIREMISRVKINQELEIDRSSSHSVHQVNSLIVRHVIRYK